MLKYMYRKNDFYIEVHQSLKNIITLKNVYVHRVVTSIYILFY